MTTGKSIALTRKTFGGKIMSLLFNMLSRLVITFLPRSKRLLISWVQSPSAGILEPWANWRSETTSLVSSFSPGTLVWLPVTLGGSGVISIPYLFLPSLPLACLTASLRPSPGPFSRPGGPDALNHPLPSPPTEPSHTPGHTPAPVLTSLLFCFPKEDLAPRAPTAPTAPPAL